MLPSNGYGDPSSQRFDQQSLYPQSPPQMFQPPTHNASRTFDQSGYNQNPVNTGVTQQNLKEISGAVRAETPQPVQKPPIPEEHVHMQTVLDELRNQCSCAANNPVSIHESLCDCNI